jgi:drug/metabolite transporter (DMT)-like permease
VPAGALGLALAAAGVHALWNLLLARARDPQAATAVALGIAVVAFAPVAALTWEVEGDAVPYVVASAVLELGYFALLAAAYARAELSLVYPLARGLAPVLVLIVAVTALGAGTSAPQVAGVLAVGGGVVLVRGLSGERDATGAVLAVGVAAGLAMFGAYALTLAALRLADAAAVAAVRESSVVIATALAAVMLHERVTRERLAGAGLVAAGVGAIALG